MDILAVALMFGALGILLLVVKAVWANGFTAGTLAEARFWLEGVDMLREPNWQSLIIDGSNMTPEQNKWMNQVYVQAYSLALYNIKEELVEARREAVEKELAKQERELRRFEGR